MKTITKFNAKKYFQIIQDVSPKLSNGFKAYLKAFNNCYWIDKVKFSMFIDWLNDIKQNYKSNTQHRYLYDMLNLIKFAALHNTNIDVYCYKKILSEKRPNRPKKTKDRPDLWSAEEIKQIPKLAIRHIAKKYLHLLCLYFSGLRLFESLRIKLEDCKIENDIVIIAIRRGKGNRQRIAIIPKNLYIKIIKNFNSKTYLFENKFGRAYHQRTVQTWYEEIGKSFGKKLHPHLMKHCFVTNQLDNKTDIAIVSKIVGTSIPVLLDTYHHPDFKPDKILKIQSKGIKI